MGGGNVYAESILIILWAEQPPFVAQIRKNFPQIEVTYIRLEDSGSGLTANRSGVPLGYGNSYDEFSPINARRVPKNRLKWIHLFSAGIDHLAKHPIIVRGNVQITTSSGIHGPPIAEWVLMTTLIASKQYHVNYENQKQHKWGSNATILEEGTDWVGKKVGIAGYGSIGRQVANVFHALGSQIHAYTASPRNSAEARADNGYLAPQTGDATGCIPSKWFSGINRESLYEFLSSGLDLLVISLPLTPKTQGLLGEEEFKLLGPTCYVVNVSRGRILDQDALIAALNNRGLKGAALDVAYPEPLPQDHPLWDARNCIVSPHLSSAGREYSDRSADILLQNLARWKKGDRLLNLVDSNRGY